MPELFKKYIEQDLLVSIQNGSKQDFGVLYDKYSPYLLGAIKRIVENDKLAEDVLLKSFLQIWARIGNYTTSNGSLLLWMIQIAKREAIENVQPKPKRENEPADGNLLELIYFQGQMCAEVAKQLTVETTTLHKLVRVEIKKLREGMITE